MERRALATGRHHHMLRPYPKHYRRADRQPAPLGRQRHGERLTRRMKSAVGTDRPQDQIHRRAPDEPPSQRVGRGAITGRGRAALLGVPPPPPPPSTPPPPP